MSAGSPRVKICGLRRAADASEADRAGADYLGVVLTPGFGRSVTGDAARELLHGTQAMRVAVLVDESPERAIELGQQIGAAVLQLHGSEPPEYAGSVRRAGPWQVWKSVRARTVADVTDVVTRYGKDVDGILVEGWRDGVVGGGGAVLEAPAEAVRAAVSGSLDLILAGGLTPEGVADAVARFSPNVVDVSSGVERAFGEKDAERIRAFIRNAGVASPSASGDDLQDT